MEIGYEYNHPGIILAVNGADMKRLILFSLILSCNIHLFAQGQYNNWHFGINNAISFNAGYPAVVNNSQIISEEACATISDSTGNLLFYTNGDTIWCRDNSIMPDGTGLSGRPNIQQGVLIVPLPGTTNIYYVFTIGKSRSSNSRELSYSIINMTLNDSLGDVSSKNTLLDSNVTEKLTATKNGDDSDFWIVEKNLYSNAFKAYSLTSTGLDTVPVVSAVGVPIQKDDYTGAIKISNNGCWLISTIRGIFGDPGIVELFHFDNIGGTVYDGVSTTSIQHPYGLEFSPNSSKFYIGENDIKPIWQFNLNAGNESDDIQSKIPVSEIIDTTYDFQLAPDNTIYIVTNDSTILARIANPNSYGFSCNIEDSAVTGLYSNTFCLPNNFNLTYRGLLSCDAGQRCFDVDDLNMASAFTPNGDGHNDCYGIKYKHGDSLHIIDFSIYNRWGNQVFYTTNVFDCWDGTYKGKMQDPGVFVYEAKVVFLDDHTRTTMKGSITLVR